MQFTKKQKVAAVLGAGAVAVAGSGVAFAYWTSTGGGNGSASTYAGETNVLAVHQDDAVTPMFPGDSAQTIRFTVTNTGHSNYALKSVTVKIASVTVDDGTPAHNQVTAPACGVSDFKLDDAVAGASGVTENIVADGSAYDLVPAGSGTPVAGSTVQRSFKIGFNNKLTNQDGCKAATVNLSYTTVSS